MANLPDKLYQTLQSAVKVLLYSRKGVAKKPGTGKTLIVLGNGPSLAETMAKHARVLKETDTMAVNFAPISEAFFELKPKYLVLVDPHFFSTPIPGTNLELLHAAIKRVDWPLTIFVPRRANAEAYRQPSVTLHRINDIGIEGFKTLNHWAFRHGLGMPRPRNVLIPAIMLGIAEGYSTIMVAGADHSWMKTLSVTDDNVVVSVQPHFYKNSEKEEARAQSVFRDYHIHEVVESYAVAFRSHVELDAYARSVGVKIINVTPGSFIDAYERGTLE